MTEQHVAAMTTLLERRGPDGTHRWVSGNVALGHTLLATTPEAIHETLPLTEPQSGCTITADVRLDNREDLFAALGIDPAGRTVGDGELILRAYLKWGEDCPKHLRGDFAFAIWDPREGRLFCVRDHMGMRQLIYCHVPGKVFAFATESRAVLTHPQVPARINEGRIADYLEDYLEGIDFESTFFEDVYRLPPASCLSVSSGRVRQWRYWTLEPQRELKLGSDDEYAEAFLEVFTRAVESRLRSAGPVGSMLSGGMDSGSVAGVASQVLVNSHSGPLMTFSAIGPDAASCRETRTIHKACTMPGIEPHAIDFSQMGDLAADIARLTAQSDEPFDFEMGLVRAVYRLAASHGVTTMLDGVGGDILLSPATYLADLVRTGRWRQAYREIAGTKEFHGSGFSTSRAFLQQAARALAPRQLVSVKRRRVVANQADRFTRHNAGTEEFARRAQLAQRKRRFLALRPPPRASLAQERINGITHTYMTVGRERYDRVAGQQGIEPRDPFMDLRLIQFSLSLPARQLAWNGWPKIILRRAMQDILPDDVRWRRGKEHLGWDFTKAIIGASEDLRRAMADTSVLPPQLRELAGFADGQDLDTATARLNVEVGALSAWCRHAGIDC